MIPDISHTLATESRSPDYNFGRFQPDIMVLILVHLTRVARAFINAFSPEQSLLLSNPIIGEVS